MQTRFERGWKGGWTVLTSLVFLTAGCGDDEGGDPTAPESDLTQAEALEIFGEVMGAVFSVGLGAPAPVGTPLAQQTITINESAPCEGGGTIDLTGTFDYDVDQAGNGTYGYNLVQTPNNCGVATSSGASYTVNGNPNIQMNGSYTIASGAPVGAFGMTFTGGMSWVGGGESGSCTIDLTYSFNWTAGSGTVQGTMCGYSLNTTY